MLSHSAPTAFASHFGDDRLALLRASLKLDAIATGLVGAAALAGGPLVADLLGLPATLLVAVGAFLVPYAALVWVAGASRALVRRGARAAIWVNLLWVVLSVAALALGWLAPTVLGTAVVLLQAAAVAVFAALQIVALNKARAAA